MLEEMSEAKTLLRYLLKLDEEVIDKLPALYKYEAKKFRNKALKLNLR